MPGFSCPSCGFEVANIPPAFSGKKVRCKKCSEVFQLPVFDEPIAAEMAEVVEAGSPFNFNAGAGPAPSFSTSNYASPGTMPGGYRKKSNTAATVALCLGIASIVLFWVPILGILLCLAGLVTSIFGFLGAKKGNGGIGFSITGGVLSLLGIVIYIVLIVIVFSSMDTIMNSAKIKAAKLQLEGLETPLEQYAKENGEYPATLDDLRGKNGSKQFIEGFDSDPWGRPFEYERLSGRNNKGYRLYSVGPDGESGTNDDVHPDKKSKRGEPE
jgi:general secretion pathway protein G